MLLSDVMLNECSIARTSRLQNRTMFASISGVCTVHHSAISKATILRVNTSSQTHRPVRSTSGVYFGRGKEPIDMIAATHCVLRTSVHESPDSSWLATPH